MSMSRLGRAVATYSLGIAVALQGLGALIPSVSHAASPELRIAEIDWAGSAASAADQWIELVNTGALPIVFNDATPYKLVVGSSPSEVTYNLGTSYGVLAAGQVMVIHKQALSSSTLSAVPTASYVQEPTLDLPVTASEYKVYDDTGALTDTIADPDGVGPLLPVFKGTASTTATHAASMSRSDILVDGSIPGNWYTSRTLGVGFKPTASMQFGTPGTTNADMQVPVAAISPAYSTTDASASTVSGTVAMPATSVTVTYTRTSYDPSATPFSREYTAPVSSGTFTTTATVPALIAGRYVVEVQATDVDGNRSMKARVASATGSAMYDYVILPTASSVAMPTLTALPMYTNQGTTTVVGTLDAMQSYNSVEVLRNGAFYGSFPVSGTTVSVPVILVPNHSNVITLSAVTTDGVLSQPASVSTIHDSIAPLKVDVSKVTVTANAPGGQDSFMGQAGAAEGGTTLLVYADAAMAKLLAQLTVAADGSFGTVQIGDNLYANLYLVLQDAAGNKSLPATVVNPITNSTQANSLNAQATQVTDSSVTVTWTKVDTAVKYRVKYRVVGGTYSAPMDVCINGNATCAFSTMVKNLSSDVDYQVAVAAVDAAGNESAYSEALFHTNAQVVVVPAAVTETVTPEPVKKATPVVTGRTDKVTTTTTEATPVPTPSATPTGEVKSESTTASRNWTPWIVLAVLVGIAALATTGYFYWFGGEAGEAALASVMAERAKNQGAADGSGKKTDTPKKGDSSSNKRW